jgi:hypothetical protein
MTVFLLLQNDAVLGVYATGEGARKAAGKVRSEYTQRTRHHWTKLPGAERWYTPDGGIARLAIEEVEVQP